MRKGLLRGLVAAVTFAVAGLAAAADTYELGKQYSTVREQAPAPDAKKVLVQEFFWYGCPHCYALDPTVTAWLAKKPADVDFERVPNTLGRPIGEVHERAYYIAKALGVVDKIHKPLFDAIHAQHQPMSSLDQIAALFQSAAGVKPQDFNGVAHSFMVDADMRRADQLAMSYGIDSVPAFVIDGRWITDAGKAGGEANVPKVIDFLVDKARKERKK